MLRFIAINCKILKIAQTVHKINVLRQTVWTIIVGMIPFVSAH